MKNAHNVYTENNIWKRAKKASITQKSFLQKELLKHPDGSSSAFIDLAYKAILLLVDPGIIHDKSTDWKSIIMFSKSINLPISKYISQMP
jgi:hypothetical protein